MYDSISETMVIVGGNEKHGKVNSVFSFEWDPSRVLSNYINQSSLLSDLVATMECVESNKFS